MSRRRKLIQKRQRARRLRETIAKVDTKPELHVQKLLTHFKQDYLTQFPLCGYFYDAYVPSKKLLIEVHGNYWHSNPLKYKRSEWNRLQVRNYKRDCKKLAIALNHGYNIIYIWEGDLQHRVRTVRKELEEILNNDFSGRRMLLENIFPEYATFYKVRENER